MKMDDLKNLDLQELVENLQNLDFENVGSWPVAVKIAAAVIVFVIVLVLGYSFQITGLQEQHERLAAEENRLLQDFERKAHRAQNLDQYRRQMEEMEESFGSLLQQLPRDTEVPGLLEDITHTGLGSGLEFENISLASETERELYAELPIQIEVKGDYHGFGSFVSGVASLPRIVTLHDFEITPPQRSARGTVEGDGLLKMTITARTYRYATRSETTRPAARQQRSRR